MTDNSLSEKIVSKMYDSDWFSQWLGIERVKVEDGSCILRMVIRKEMLNGFAIAHGGITYSLADSALAFASNSHGRMSVSVETGISHTVSLKEGDVITAVAEEMSLTNKIGIYHVTIKNQEDKIVALFKGTIYRTSKEWEIQGNTVTDKRIDTDLRNGEKGTSDNNIDEKDNEVLELDNYRNYETEKVTIFGHEKNSDAKGDKESVKNDKLIYPELSYKIIGSAFEVFNNVGSSHKESIYQKALFEIFQNNKLKIEQQVYAPVEMRNKIVGKNYFDFLVEDKIVVEIKSADKFSKSHYNQLLNYLIVSKLKLGLLISFGRDEVKYKRVLNIDLLNKEKRIS
ncbi:MAG: GxxExxY protein [Bacteroidota bacterium]